MISQCLVSRHLPFFVEGFHKRLGCGYGYAPTKPTFFVGMYSDFDYARLSKHGSLAVVIFCGSDAFKLGERKWFDKRAKRLLQSVKVVAISKDIEDALSKHGIKSVRYNVCPTDADRFSVTKPTKQRVYVYYNDAHKHLFDWVVYEAVVNHYKGSTVIVDNIRDKAFVNPLDMPKEYEECFIGMKPYLQDGYGNTQVELALSGRQCISNGAFVGNLRYKGAGDVIDHIDEALKNVNDVGLMNRLRTLALKEIELPQGFNEIKFWR